MKLDNGDQLKHVLKRPREDSGDDEGPLNFKQKKRVRIRDVLVTTEDLMVLKEAFVEVAPHSAWRGEGPFDPYAEIWEEIWDENIRRQFREHH